MTVLGWIVLVAYKRNCSENSKFLCSFSCATFGLVIVALFCAK